MSDSQNWGSFDDDEASKGSSRSRQRKKAAAAAALVQTDALNSEASASGGVLDNLRSLNLVTFRNRLMFGGLVGFCTGATFGGSECNTSQRSLVVLCLGIFFLKRSCSVWMWMY